MKKNLLTFVFVIAFLCGGALAVSAKTASSSGNSVAVSKRISPAKTISNKIKALEAKCAMVPCESQLIDLIDANAYYEILCGGTGYPVGCGGLAEQYLLERAAVYELCLWWNGYSKNIDKTKDRNKRQGPNV